MIATIPIKQVFFNGSFTYEQIINMATESKAPYKVRMDGTTLELNIGNELYFFYPVGIDHRLHSTLYCMY